MPELPEVETTRRHLEPAVTGEVITRVEVRRRRMIRRQPRPEEFVDRMVGRRVERMGRRGKFLMASLEGDLTWVTHLGMSGRIELANSGDPERPHTNVVLEVGGREVRLVDPRTFGFMAVLTPEEFDGSSLAALGPDALEDLPTTRGLEALLEGRAVPIKPLLLDQRLVSGLGNIYADEVLFRAKVDPARPGGSLSHEEVKSIRAAIRPVLRDGLRHGGTSLDDLAYLLPDGRAGEYFDRLRVYGREDLPCRTCGTAIQRRVLRARSTFSCPRCQS